MPYILLINHYKGPYLLSNSSFEINTLRDFDPSKGEIYRGGYEVKCYKTERVQPLKDDADFSFVQETLETLERL